MKHHPSGAAISKLACHLASIEYHQSGKLQEVGPILMFVEVRMKRYEVRVGTPSDEHLAVIVLTHLSGKELSDRFEAMNRYMAHLGVVGDVVSFIRKCIVTSPMGMSNHEGNSPLTTRQRSSLGGGHDGPWGLKRCGTVPVRGVRLEGGLAPRTFQIQFSSGKGCIKGRRAKETRFQGHLRQRRRKEWLGKGNRKREGQRQRPLLQVVLPLWRVGPLPELAPQEEHAGSVPL